MSDEMDRVEERSRQHLRGLIDASGRSLSELHRDALALGLVGMDPSTLCRMANGQRRVHIDRVARLFDVDPAHLVAPYPVCDVPAWLDARALADRHIEAEGLHGADATLTAAHICDMADRWRLWTGGGVPRNGWPVGVHYYVPARPAREGEPYPVEW